MNFEKLKIKEIENILYSNKTRPKSIGMSNGILGISFFYYYMFKLTQEENFLSVCVELFEEAIDRLSESYSSANYKADIVELGLYSVFLSNNEIVEIEQDFFETLDEIILEFTKEEIKAKNLHNLSGALLGGFYFIKRKLKTQRSSTLLSILSLIEEKAVTIKNETYWLSDFRKHGKIELNLNHGTCGIISFLIELYNCDIEKDRCSSLIISGFSFIINQKKDNTNKTLFPFFAFENNFLEYSNLSYGDISIGYTLLKGGEALHDKTLINEGLSILSNVIKKSRMFENNIKEASLIYGSCGLTSIYSYIYHRYNLEEFKEGYTFWNNKTKEFSHFSNKWAGFTVYFKSNMEIDTQLSFAHGIAGIGISLISSILNENTKDYLQFLKYNI